MRIGQAATEARVGESLAYGGQQEGFKQSSIDRLIQSWAQLAGLGAGGAGMAATGIQMGNQAAQDYYGGMGGLFGNVLGMGAGFAMNKYQLDRLAKMK